MCFVEYVRTFHEEQDFNNLEAAITRAIDRCIKEDVLAEFFRENRTEVVKVAQLDYTFDRQIMLEREEARNEGWTEGHREGRSELIFELVRDGNCSFELGAEKLGISVDELRKKLADL